MAVLPAVIGLLLAGFVTAQNMEVTPREAILKVGDDVNMLCKVAYRIDSCRVTVGGQRHILKPGEQSGDVFYSGQGFQNGECGAHIRNIREEWNGNVSCEIPNESGNLELSGIMKLVVAKAPERPLLVLSHLPPYKEGDVLQARCEVHRGRPAAKISWMMDEQPLLDGVHQPHLETDPATDLTSISQNLTRTLSADDSQSSLICRSEQPAMSQPAYASAQLDVHFAPKRQEAGPITIFGLQIGAEGVLNVTVRSNPPPSVEWTVSGERLTPGRTTQDGSVAALAPQLIGKNYYNCSLRVDRITREDVDRTYYLRVYNDYGSEEFAVKLSTMAEPAGVELDTGAIVGIVVAVLVLLIVVFLIVFAKATDRWCFGGRSHRTDIPDGADSEAPLPPHDDVHKGSENPSHEGDYIINDRRRDHTKSSGESTPAGDVLLESVTQQATRASDTESAVGGRPERSRLAELGARVRAALPRGKDKVQATEAPAAEQEEKDKKDVVYAELALGEAAREKPPPPSTEYAQIVYTSAPETPAQTQEAKES